MLGAYLITARGTLTTSYTVRLFLCLQDLQDAVFCVNLQNLPIEHAFWNLMAQKLTDPDHATDSGFKPNRLKESKLPG